jgi:hypothetical protein
VPAGIAPGGTLIVALAEPSEADAVVEPDAATWIDTGVPNADAASPEGGGAFVGPTVAPPPPPPPPPLDGAEGVTDAVAEESAPVPIELIAATVKVYESPFVSPSIEQLSAVLESEVGQAFIVVVDVVVFSAMTS